MTNSEVSDPAFWEWLYAQERQGWELGQPAPPLLAYLEAKSLPLGRVAVLGCGRGHDARLFAERGYQTWGVDIAASAIRDATALTRAQGVPVHFEECDVFDLPRDYAGFFDGVWEYTCFCAIDPARRQEYMEVVRTILKPGGWFLACFYPIREGAGGPPFPVSKSEVRHLFRSAFHFEEEFVPDNSIERRRGQEWVVRAVKRAVPLNSPGKEER